MKVINLFGGPGAGKSTAASGLFYEMKKRWIQAEYVPEFAKEMVWADTMHLLSHQNYIFANQEYRLSRLQSKVDFAVSDSPLLLSAFYAPAGYPLSFIQSVFDFFARYDNINLFVLRSHKYSGIGRLQNEDESDKISAAMQEFLLDNGIPFYTIPASDASPRYLLSWLVKEGHIVLPDSVQPMSPEDSPPPGWIAQYQERLDDLGSPVRTAAAVGHRHLDSSGVRTVGIIKSLEQLD
jgi:hypothetical protein